MVRSEFGDGRHLVLMLTCGACGDVKCCFVGEERVTAADDHLLMKKLELIRDMT